MKHLKWLAPVVAALGYAAWQSVARQVYAANLPPFDLHLYGFAEAQTYLAALTPVAKATYTDALHQIDLVLLISLTATLILPVWRRTRLLALPALIYAGADVLENRAVAAVLTQTSVTAPEVAQIALLTAVKFTALAIATACALWALWRGRA